MLIRFNVGNFLSFKDVQEYSMLAGKVRSKKEHLISDENLKLLKFAAVFGANASGKSNFVKAIEFAKNTILFGLKRIYNFNGWYKLDESYKERESYFEFEIKIGNQYYAYGFEMSFDKRVFTSEWLVELYPNGEQRVIFERDIKAKTIKTELVVCNEELRTKFSVYADDIRTKDKILFINELNRAKSDLLTNDPDLKIFSEIFKWFAFSLDINHPLDIISDFSYFESFEKDFIIDVIKSFGTGITGFNIIEVTEEEVRDKIPEKVFMQVQEHINKLLLDDDAPKNATMTLRSADTFFILNIEEDQKVKVTTLEFEHGKTGMPFGFSISEESEGTRRIIELIQILLAEENRVFIIDEIDRSLHPQLTYRFIENFLKVAARKNIQLIVTTHESRLLDFGLLRQDEIWLVDKNTEGESQLYSLDEYNVRFDQKIDKAYLEGRYGGVPIFTTLFPN